MADSRLRRFVGGLGVGYVHAIVTVTVGLWLTPYLLRNLGSHDYGLWLLGAQVLVYLALMDLGVVQLVPRDVAIAAGRAKGDYSELQTIVGQTARIVVWQIPPVALVGGLIVWFLPADWAPLRWPLAIVIVTFVVAFPLRLFNGVLQGLQDLAFLGRRAARRVGGWCGRDDRRHCSRPRTVLAVGRLGGHTADIRDRRLAPAGDRTR